jgi:hypothetical protein
MKKQTLVAGLVTLFLADVVLSGCGQGGTQATTAGSTNAPPPDSTRSLATVASQATDQMTTYLARSGSKMRIEGTANIIHPTWQIESPIIGGMLEVGPGFPIEPGQAATPGKIEANGKVFISVRSLKSVSRAEEGNFPIANRRLANQRQVRASRTGCGR